MNLIEELPEMNNMSQHNSYSKNDTAIVVDFFIAKQPLRENFQVVVYIILCLVGAAGFEPTNAGVKVLCLTAWLYPKHSLKHYNKNPAINQYRRIYIFILTYISYC